MHTMTTANRMQNVPGKQSDGGGRLAGQVYCGFIRHRHGVDAATKLRGTGMKEGCVAEINALALALAYSTPWVTVAHLETSKGRH